MPGGITIISKKTVRQNEVQGIAKVIMGEPTELNAAVSFVNEVLLNEDGTPLLNEDGTPLLNENVIQ